MADRTHRGVPLSTLCPKFLHTNSTSHTWPFSAIAELIDNAYDPDVSAKQFWIDKTMVQGQECLSFMDNGNGLNPETIHKMLSFGYSDKVAVNGLEPIGIYGNGFKSGSMRLGKDAIVFSKSKSTLCVGMLSQTYLEKIGAQQIIVPIVCFEEGAANKLSVREEHQASLRDILCYSPFKTQEELLLEINAITSSLSTATTGTRIIIWNLRSTSTGTTEFDFEKDRYDIRIPSDVYESMNDPSRHPGTTSYIPESVYSLRAYCSILYLKPRMQIIIRGQKVKSQLIAKSLAFIRKDHYRPTFLTKRIPIAFGYNTKSKDQYGVMMYHKNRLIKAYERVGCQLKANIRGVGVIGVIECNFLDPTHNKQSFIETDKYRKTMNSLGIKLEEYWMEIRHKRSKENPDSIPVEDTMKQPDQNWAQCDNCLKWRKLPDGIDCSKLPDKWYCRMNPDPQFRNCLAEEEPEDSDDEQRSYRKTYKQQGREDKRKERRQREVEERKRQQEKHMAYLQQQQENLMQQLHQSGSPARDESSTISQAACSPSVFPVITSVCSLSAGPLRGKREHPATPQRTPKRLKVNGFHLGAPDTSALLNDSPQSSPSVAVDDSTDVTDDSEDDDDVVFILETASTPKPQKTNVTKVKTECSDDGALDVASKKNSAASGSTGSAATGASPSLTSHVEVASSTTQTEVPKVKKEERDLDETDNRGKRPDPLRSESEAGPSRVDVSTMDIQNQQDHLPQLMQATAQERDSCKEQVLQLTRQLREAQSRLQELSRIRVKKECCHQASQTQETEGATDYKSLFEKARQKVNELMKGKEALLAAAQTNGEKIDKLTMEVDHLRFQLTSQGEERANLATRCEELNMRLQQQQRENAQEGSKTLHRTTSAQTDSERAALSTSLIELRHNIGRLLVSFVPALDLGQVNYECNVIDEILEQVLSLSPSLTITSDGLGGSKISA